MFSFSFPLSLSHFNVTMHFDHLVFFSRAFRTLFNIENKDKKKKHSIFNSQFCCCRSVFVFLSFYSISLCLTCIQWKMIKTKIEAKAQRKNCVKIDIHVHLKGKADDRLSDAMKWSHQFIHIHIHIVPNHSGLLLVVCFA